MKKHTIGVLGIGTIGKRIIDDLHSTYDGPIVAIGHDTVDVSKPRMLASALRGIDVLVHAVHHEYNLAVMEACLKTNTHYLDLGGLYHYTIKQLAMDEQFRKNGLTAILGMGAAPGITNMLAAFGATQFEHVDSIEIYVGMIDHSTYRHLSPLGMTYSIQTILEEFSWRPAVFAKGKMTFIAPLSGRQPYTFPAPVGVQKPHYTIHSELATLPHTLKAKEVFFKIAFPDDFMQKIQILKYIGLLEPHNVPFTTAVLKRLPPTLPQTIEQYEIIEVRCTGSKNGKKHTLILDAHVAAKGETIDKDTAVPASIVAQMIARREIARCGVFPPENIVPIKAFFRELKQRNIFIYKRTHTYEI